MEPLGSKPLSAGICLCSKVRRAARLPVGCRWAPGCPAPRRRAGRAARGGTPGGCRSVLGTWAVPGPGTPAAAGTAGSPHAPAGTARSAPGTAHPARALTEEGGRSETWTEWGSTLLKQGKGRKPQDTERDHHNCLQKLTAENPEETKVDPKLK